VGAVEAAFPRSFYPTTTVKEILAGWVLNAALEAGHTDMHALTGTWL
jgi:hypothetical protein